MDVILDIMVVFSPLYKVNFTLIILILGGFVGLSSFVLSAIFKTNVRIFNEQVGRCRPNSGEVYKEGSALVA